MITPRRRWPTGHIIIEGPDGAGKTTLARQLCHDLRMAYHHEGPPPVSTSVLHHYAALLANTKRPTVFDRFHLGELVYGPLLRGVSGLNPTDIRLMNRLVRGNGIAVIICLPEWGTCLERTRQRDEFIKDETKLKEAHRLWCTMVDAFDHVNTQVLNDGEGCDPAVRVYDALPDGVIGSPSARLLLIGEQPNSRTLDLPFFGTARSSGFLNERLQDAGISEGDIAVTNALTLEGQARDLGWIISQMPQLKVVVPLGRVALGQLEQQDVPDFVDISPVPHPQYWKRFHASDAVGYVKRLIDVARIGGCDVAA